MSEDFAEEFSGKASEYATLRGLTEHPGWELFHKMLEEQKVARLGTFAFRPLAGMDEVPAQEFTKGEYSGLALAQVALFAHMETLKSEIEAVQKLQEKKDELEKQNSDAASRSGRVDGESFSE